MRRVIDRRRVRWLVLALVVGAAWLVVAPGCAALPGGRGAGGGDAGAVQRVSDGVLERLDTIERAIGELEPAGPEEAERLDRVAGELAALRDVVAAVRDAAGGEGTAGERAGRGLDAAAGAAALLPPPWGTVAAAVLGAAGVGLTWLRGRGQVGRVLEAAGEVVRSWDVAAAQDPSAAEAIERAKPYLRAAQGAEARRLVARARGKAA